MTPTLAVMYDWSTEPEKTGILRPNKPNRGDSSKDQRHFMGDRTMPELTPDSSGGAVLPRKQGAGDPDPRGCAEKA